MLQTNFRKTFIRDHVIRFLHVYYIFVSLKTVQTVHKCQRAQLPDTRSYAQILLAVDRFLPEFCQEYFWLFWGILSDFTRNVSKHFRKASDKFQKHYWLKLRTLTAIKFPGMFLDFSNNVTKVMCKRQYWIIFFRKAFLTCSERLY